MASYRDYRNGSMSRSTQKPSMLRRVLPLLLVALLLALIWLQPLLHDALQEQNQNPDSFKSVGQSDNVLQEGQSSTGSDAASGVASGDAYIESNASGSSANGADDAVVINRVPDDTVRFGDANGTGQEGGSAVSVEDGVNTDNSSTSNSYEFVDSSGGFMAEPYVNDMEGRPESGFIFESRGRGRSPQLVVVAPSETDAYVKLKSVDSGETMLAFYVRAGTQVQACAPIGRYEFSYALGHNWQGLNNYFGPETQYAKSDKELNFFKSTNVYTYMLQPENEDWNINPIPIEKRDFVS